MTEEKTRRVRLIYEICLSVLTGIVGLLFIMQVWSIYRAGGDNPYTVDSISAHFKEIAVPVWLWIMVILLGAAFPQAKSGKMSAFIDPKTTLQKLKSRLSETTDLAEMRKERNLRAIVWCVSLLLCVVSAVVCLVYLFNSAYKATFAGEFFATHTEVEKFIKMTPWILAALGVCCFAAYFTAHSVKKETALVKNVLAENAKKGVKLSAPKAEKPTFTQRIYQKIPFLATEKWTLCVRIGLCVVGLVFVVWGILNGGVADVLTKAVNICTQCIGLG